MYSVSKKYNMTVKELQDLNNLTSSALSVGQILNTNSSTTDTVAQVSNSKLPVKTAISNKIHIVEKGETLYSISKKYDVSINDLQQLNGLTNNGISIGQELEIKNR